MKGLLIRNAVIVALITCLSIVPACKKEAPNGQIAIQMGHPEQPSRFSLASVEITGAEVHYQNQKYGNNGWIVLQTNPAVYYLVVDKRILPITIAYGNELPPGRINEIRLRFGQNNTLKIGDGSENFVLSDRAYEGAKIPLDAQIQSYNKLKLVLDWDVNSSIREIGNNTYELDPFIRIEQSYTD
jgi:hypothetical protein